MSLENLRTIDTTVNIAGIDVQSVITPREIAGVKSETPRITTTLPAGELFNHFAPGSFNLFQTVDFAGKVDDTSEVVERIMPGNSDIGVFNAEEQTPELLQDIPNLTAYSLLTPDGTVPKAPITVITRVAPKNERGVDLLLSDKRRYNADPNSSDVLIDPCEIDLNLIREDCEFKSGGGVLCALGIVMKEGQPYCPLEPNRQLTLRSTFASTEAPVDLMQ